LLPHSKTWRRETIPDYHVDNSKETITIRDKHPTPCPICSQVLRNPFSPSQGKARHNVVVALWSLTMIKGQRDHFAGMLAAVLLFVGLSQGISAAENRDTKVRNDKSQVEATGKWIYNDLEKALNEGRRAGKPILVTLRCIP
jgi:hypothetical protein